MINPTEIQKLPRTYLPADFKVTEWSAIEPFLKELLEREITSKGEMEKWLLDMSEVEAMLTEDICWRQIRMTCDTNNKELEESFTFFAMQIQPKIEPYAFALNKKLVESPFIEELDKDKYFTYLRSVRNSIELFREENIPLQSELSVLQQQYGVITGQMEVGS